MTEFLRIFLPTYFIVYFGIAFVAKSVIVAKRIGKNPLVWFLPCFANYSGNGIVYEKNK